MLKTFLMSSILTLLLAGCSIISATSEALETQVVEPWERDTLAHESMQLPADAMESYTDDHIYFSKEAATGGKGVGGGGCGCN